MAAAAAAAAVLCLVCVVAIDAKRSVVAGISKS
jgi:hypothetical protein